MAGLQLADLSPPVALTDLCFYCENCEAEWDPIELAIMQEGEESANCFFDAGRQLLCPDCGSPNLQVGLDPFVEAP